MHDTVYLIFTNEGFAEMQSTFLEQEITLWVNKGVLSEEQLTELKQSNTTVYTLPDHIDASNERSVLSPVKHVEQQSPQAEIFVEYL